MVVNTGFDLFVCDTVTGNRVKSITPASVSWAMKLNEAGTIAAGLMTETPEGLKLDLRTSTASVRQSLGISYNGNILECGPIWGRKSETDKGQLQLDARGLWSMFDKRKAIPAAQLGSAAPAKIVWKITKGSLGAIARELVWDSITNNAQLPGGNAGALNIILPADVPGTTQVRTYNGYEMANIGARLKELTEAGTAGPDIRFRPRFKSGDPGTVEWVMEIGAPLLQQTGPDLKWNVSLERSGPVHLAWDEDATELAARAYALGAGQEAQKKIAYATYTGLLANGWPWTEIDESHDVETQSVLQGHADRLLQQNRAPWLTWDLTVRADIPPLLGTYQPGDWAELYIPEGHPQFPAGLVRVRIMSISGGPGETVKLAVAPIQGKY